MQYRVIVIAAIAVTLGVGSGYGQQSTAPSEVMTSPSPDRSLVAIVTYFQKGGAPGESKVELRTRSGQELAQWSYLSDDGEHGYGVAKMQWTPDSQFFVYSLESSGGHQPWHSPVQYFSRKGTRFLSLDNALGGAVMNPDFGVAAPDEVTVDLYPNKNASVSLSKLETPR
jgi:hypothetical protein